MGGVAKLKWQILSIVSILGLFFDWYTKYLAVTRLSYGALSPVLGRVLQWQLIFNKGAIFGINPQSFFPAFPTNIFFYIFSCIAIVLLVFYYRSIEPDAVYSYWGISLIMPGALGNLLDRIVRPGQGVVDFIRFDAGFPPFNPWPIFNLADVYISVGVMLIVLDLWLMESKKKVIQQG